MGPHPDQEACGGRDHGRDSDAATGLVAPILGNEAVVPEGGVLERVGETPDHSCGKSDLDLDQDATSFCLNGPSFSRDRV